MIFCLYTVKTPTQGVVAKKLAFGVTSRGNDLYGICKRFVWYTDKLFWVWVRACDIYVCKLHPLYFWIQSKVSYCAFHPLFLIAKHIMPLTSFVRFLDFHNNDFKDSAIQSFSPQILTSRHKHNQNYIHLNENFQVINIPHLGGSRNTNSQYLLPYRQLYVNYIKSNWMYQARKGIVLLYIQTNFMDVFM